MFNSDTRSKWRKCDVDSYMSYAYDMIGVSFKLGRFKLNKYLVIFTKKITNNCLEFVL